jgi:hypothetical protein
MKKIMKKIERHRDTYRCARPSVLHAYPERTKSEKPTSFCAGLFDRSASRVEATGSSGLFLGAYVK